MNSKSVLILVLAIAAGALAIGIFVGRSAAPPPAPIPEVSEKKKEGGKTEEPREGEDEVPSSQARVTEESSATLGFGDRLALIQAPSPKLPDRLPVIEAPLYVERVANVAGEPTPRIPLVRAAVEKSPQTIVEPIRISGPGGSAPKEDIPMNLGLLAPPSLSELSVEPGGESPLRPVPLLSPSGNKKPGIETGSLRQLKRPVRDRSEQGQSADYPVAQSRAEPASEDFKMLARFSAREWSARHSLQPDRLHQVTRRRAAPDSLTGVAPPSPMTRSEASSSTPEVRLSVQNSPAGGTESIPELEFKDPIPSVRLQTPRPISESLLVKPGENPESLIAVSFSMKGRESYSMKAAPLWPESLKSSSHVMNDPDLLTSKHPEPAPGLNVLTDWPPLSTFETDLQQPIIEFPLPGLYSPAELNPSETPAEIPQHPHLPLPPIDKQL
jgi:hypothetical protein